MNTEKVNAIMSRKGITTGDIAHAMDVTERTAARKIKGQSPITCKQAEAVANLLHMTDEDYLGVFFD